MKLLTVALLLFCSINAYSALLAENVKILRMANISSNVDGFYLNVGGGGTGPCNTGSIFFKTENMPNQSQEALNRAVSMASMAFAMDLYVQIHNYTDDDCHGASYIRISKTKF